MKNICLTCNIETNNPKFCSQRCSAINSNIKRKGKIRRASHCRKCKNVLDTQNSKPSSKICLSCSKIYTDWTTITIKDLKDKLTKMGSTLQFHARVRNLARASFNKINCCTNCGYTKHTQICHIKPIAKFDESTTTIAEVNDKSNLVELCPNCHWEFDHNMLVLDNGLEPLPVA